MKKVSLHKILLTALCAASISATFAQRSADYKKSGDHYFKSGDYYSAAYYYQQYVDGGSGGATTAGYRPGSVTLLGKGSAKKESGGSNADVLLRLAESYRMMNDWYHAEKYYELLAAADNSDSAHADAAYWYGVSLRANGKYEEAKERLKQYIAMAGESGTFVNQAKLELQNLTFITEQQKRKDANLYTVSKMPDGVNGPETNYAGAWSGNTLVFTSTRPAAGAPGVYTNALYQSNNGVVEKISLPGVDGMEEGIATLSPDGSKLYLTKWTKEKGANVSAIYVSQKNGIAWSEPTKLNANVNVGGYNNKQPFITPDGQYLIFSSDRPGGQGRFDLWAVPLTSAGDAGMPFNLGTTINTAEDEEAPFYHQPSQTLVFASKGRVGMGGFDLYSSKGVLHGQWSNVENLGSPINSNKDDVYFSTNSNSQLLKHAVISSDRNSDYCMAMYSVNKKYKKYIIGKVVDCKTSQSLGNVAVSFGSAGTLRTDAFGTYLLEVEDFSAVSLTASKDGFDNGSLQLARPANEDADTLYNAVVCLNAVVKPEVQPQPQPMTEDAVYFDFAKYDLRPETQATLDKIAGIMSREQSLKLIVTGYTDKLGSDALNDKLSTERAKACKDYLMAKGIDASRIQAVGKGACCPLKPEMVNGKDDADARQVNRRVEFDLKLMR